MPESRLKGHVFQRVPIESSRSPRVSNREQVQISSFTRIDHPGLHSGEEKFCFLAQAWVIDRKFEVTTYLQQVQTRSLQGMSKETIPTERLTRGPWNRFVLWYKPLYHHRYERVEVPLMVIKVTLNLQQGVMLYPTFPLGKVGGRRFNVNFITKIGWGFNLYSTIG